jgi:hypothetical protein
VLVLSVKGASPDGEPSKAFGENPDALSKASIKNGGPLPNPGQQVTVDLDVPLESFVKTEAKGLVGSSTLEARVRVGENGHTQEKVVELLRTSTAHASELNRAARQMEHLREHGELSEDVDRDEKRSKCPSCGRPLPFDSAVCPFCVNKWQALRRLFSYVAPYKGTVALNGFFERGRPRTVVCAAGHLRLSGGRRVSAARRNERLVAAARATRRSLSRTGVLVGSLSARRR